MGVRIVMPSGHEIDVLESVKPVLDNKLSFVMWFGSYAVVVTKEGCALVFHPSTIRTSLKHIVNDPSLDRILTAFDGDPHNPDPTVMAKIKEISLEWFPKEEGGGS